MSNSDVSALALQLLIDFQTSCPILACKKSRKPRTEMLRRWVRVMVLFSFSLFVFFCFPQEHLLIYSQVSLWFCAGMFSCPLLFFFSLVSSAQGHPHLLCTHAQLLWGSQLSAGLGLAPYPHPPPISAAPDVPLQGGLLLPVSLWAERLGPAGLTGYCGTRSSRNREVSHWKGAWWCQPRLAQMIIPLVNPCLWVNLFLCDLR